MDFALSPAAATTAGVRAATAPPAPGAAGQAHVVTESPWTNPAAAAALRSTVDLLRAIEDGIVRNYQSGDKVSGFAVDLRSTSEIFETASSVLLGDASKENDSFLPLITTANGGVNQAESRLSSKDIQSTWPAERGDILAAIRRARAIGQNVADQLDPRSVREPR